MIQHFRVDRLIGEGGMGFVFEAVDTRLKRPVALKLVKPDASTGASGYQRFLREARLMASIQHENMVTIFDVGHVGDFPFLAMELLEGETLESRLTRERRVPPATVTGIVRQICRGLRAAHREGIVHRDIKPSNLWLQAPDDTVKILDFGLARDTSSALTQAGSLLGTPKYLSPEQARGEPVDVRTDLYSLGVTAYRMLSGQLPFDEPTTTQQLSAIVAKRPKSIGTLCPGLPDELIHVIDGLLAKEPEDRPADAESVIRLLDAIVEVRGARSTILSRFVTAIASPTALIVLGSAIVPGAVLYPILTSSQSMAVMSNESIATPSPSELDDDLPVPRSVQSRRVIVESDFITSMRRAGPSRATHVNVSYQPTYVRESAVFEFDLTDLPDDKECVDAAFTLTLKGGASSAGERSLLVLARTLNESTQPASSLTVMAEMIEMKQVVTIGRLQFDNAGYRKNGFPDGVRLRSSELIELIRDSRDRRIEIWVWRTDMSNAQTHFYANPEQPEFMPKLWMDFRGPMP
ncbi:MAG: serine/threonine-protein kinase [Planctomycetota bacterium]